MPRLGPGPVWRLRNAVEMSTECPALQQATSTHTPQDRHLAAPRTPYAAFVKEII